MREIRYYFTFNSPWSYLGLRTLREMAARAGARIEARVIDAKIVFPPTGGVPLPQRPPARKAYRLQELARWAKRRDIPLVLQPPSHGGDESGPIQLFVGARLLGQDPLDVTLEITKALWERGESFQEDATLRAAAAAAGLDFDAARAAVSPNDAAAQVAVWSREALEDGVFGMPSYVLGDQVFWGQDRLDFLEEALANGVG